MSSITQGIACEIERLGTMQYSYKRCPEWCIVVGERGVWNFLCKMIIRPNIEVGLHDQ